MAKGKSGSIRRKALLTAAFNKQEEHGKRQDVMSKRRVVSTDPPLVHSTLDLGEARAQHMRDVQQQGKTAALHFIVQFPTDLELGKTPTERDEKQRWMFNHAIRFINDYHGGDAVFAARMDRDEAGKHNVDVFAIPRVDFRYKDGRTVKRGVISKHSKADAMQRYGRDDPRAQGSALQDAWLAYMQTEMKLHWVEPPTRKKARLYDRLEPEEYKLKQDQQKLLAAREEHSEAVVQGYAKIRDQALKVRDTRQRVDERERAISERERVLSERESAVEKSEREARIALAFGRKVASQYSDREAVQQITEVEQKLRVRKLMRRDDDQR